MNEEETENFVPDKKPDPQPKETERREFIAKAVSIVAGGAIVSIPIGTGLATLVAPLFKEGQGGVKIRLASVEDHEGHEDERRLVMIRYYDENGRLSDTAYFEGERGSEHRVR